MKSLNVVFPSPGEVRVDVQEVTPLGATEVLCRATRSLLSTGTESFCLAGDFDAGTLWEEWVKYPFAPGYSMASVVVDVGSEVTRFRVGDRVASATPHAELFAVDERNAVRIPDDVTDEQACWMSLACTTQLGVRRAQLELGETVGVVGLGLLGQLVVQYLRLSGAARIVCIDTASERLELARENGATHVILASASDARQHVIDLTEGGMLDVVFDITGRHEVLAAASTLVRPLGRVILLGDTPSPSKQHLGPRIVGDSISILGVHASSAPEVATYRDRWTLQAMTELFFEFVGTGRMNVDALVSHRFGPSEAPDVYAELQVNRSAYLGVIFDWTRG
jgi:2-desacetyl-2-hydroxyethyl bacteriochlorophyllide A dehydrogenase